MDKINSLNQTADFHRLFNHPILDKPTIPDKKRCALRVELISEELRELKEAIKDKDIVEIADALCDIQYVLSGAVHEFGMSEKFVRLFNEVQRSNMSKACVSVEEAEGQLSGTGKRKIQNVTMRRKTVNILFIGPQIGKH